MTQPILAGMEDTMKITAETLQVEVVPGKLIDNPEQLGAIFNTISRSDLLAVDTETTGLDFTRDQLHGFSVAVPGDDLSWYIAGPALIPGLRALADVVKQPNKLVIGHNYKFDAHFLRRHSVYPAKIADTIVAQWLVDENLELGLKSLAYTRLGYDNLPTYGDLLMKMKRLRGVSSKNDVSIYDFPPEVIATYAARDAALTLELWQKLAFDLRSEGMEKHFWEIEMPFADALTEMEENGMFIDQVAVAELKNEWQGEADKLLARWNELTNGVNPNSGPQLRTFFFTTLKLPVQDKTKTGLPSTDDLTMQRLAPKDKSGSVEVLREYRKYQKLLSTYVSFMETAPVEGRVHGSFNHTGATTGRLSSSDPNLQNIPSKGALAHSMRKVFAAQSRDDIIVDIDYSQIELRLIAHYTKDPSLMKVFFEGLDPHQMTADLVGVPRWLGKTLNFAVSYGSGPRTLGDTIEKSGKPRPSEAESKGWLEGFGKAYPGISSWKRAAVDYARQLGYAKTIAGRKRRLPELTSYDRSTQGHAERQAISAIIQGSAADAFKWATVQFMPMVRWYDAKLTAEVHDEAVFEVPYECAEEFAQQVGGVMASIREQFNLRVPIEAAPSFGFNWGDAKENDGTIPPLESRR